MSVRQSRDELIKRGVLKEIFEKGEPVSQKDCHFRHIIKSVLLREDYVVH